MRRAPNQDGFSPPLDTHRASRGAQLPREESRSLLQDRILPAQLTDLTLEFGDPVRFGRCRPRRNPSSISAPLTQVPNVGDLKGCKLVSHGDASAEFFRVHSEALEDAARVFPLRQSGMPLNDGGG